MNFAIMNFLVSHNVLSAKQYGFRRRLGTADVLTLLHHLCRRAAGSGVLAHVLAIDIAGAFDKVSHKGVIYKAAVYGLRGPLLT